MVRTIAFGVALCLLVCGCSQAPAPSFAKYDLNGGRYFIEIENTEGGSSINFHSSGEGTKVTDERYDLSWANTRRLHIENGNLQIDGADRGTLQPGDRIVINKSGEVLVNGVKR